MSEYLILIYDAEAPYANASPELWQEVMQAHQRFRVGRRRPLRDRNHRRSAHRRTAPAEHGCPHRSRHPRKPNCLTTDTASDVIKAGGLAPGSPRGRRTLFCERPLPACDRDIRRLSAVGGASPSWS